MKILVVDDHPLIVEDILDELREIEPEAAAMGTSDATSVMKLCEQHTFDVIFMDIDMPGINGLTLAGKILKAWPRTNIIYITGHEEYALESYNTYASAFLVKPVSTRRLKDALKNLRYPVSSITEEEIAAQSAGDAVIGGRIRHFREKMNYSRSDLARTMNVSVQTVYRWESGDRIPDVVTLLEIARTLRVTMDQLTGLKS